MLPYKGRKRRQTLKALTDPQPEFVSLVFGGANKTPFRAIRADGAAVSEGEEEVAARAGTHTIARVEFSGEKFADEAAVKAWLTAGGYDPEQSITKTDTGFMVDSSSGLDKDTILGVVDLSDTQGIKLFTIAIKADDGVLELQKSQELHPGATPEMVQRYCDVMSCCESCGSDGTTIAEVIGDRSDAVPPGLMDLHWALYEAIRNCLRNGDMAGAKAALTEFGNMMDALMRMFPKETSTDAYKALIDAIAPEIEVEKEDRMSTEPEKTTEETVETVKTDETPEAVTETVEAPEAVEKTDETAETSEEVKAEETETVEAEKTDETVEAAETAEKTDEVVEETAKSDDPVAVLTALVTELTNSMKSMQDNLTGEIGKVVERVAAVEETRQTRKGADVDETSTASTTPPDVSDQISDLRRRSMLGMRRPASN
jgi:hypothetical protein